MRRFLLRLQLSLDSGTFRSPVASMPQTIGKRAPSADHAPPRITSGRWFLSVGLCCVLASSFVHAQVPVSVPGIDGLLFQEADSSYSVALADSFLINGVRILSDSLTLSYDQPAGRFMLFGGARAVIEDTSLRVSLGTFTEPGIVIDSGSLTSARFLITQPFGFKSQSFLPETLWFAWQMDSMFAMHGTASVLVGTDTVKVSAGTQGSPGILFTKGRLDELRLQVSARFILKGITFSPDSVGLVYRASDTTFALHGSLAVLVANDSIRLSAGTESEPGIEIVHGELERLELSVGAEFSIKGLKFLPDSLGFVYRATDTTFTMHGSLAIVVGSDSIKVSAGTRAEPGIEFANGELKRIELGVGAEFSIKSLKFLPDSLGIVYRASDSTFTMHGSLAVVVASDSIKVSAGTQTQPGIEFANGELKRLELNVGAEFTIKGLKFLPDSLGFVYRASDTTFTLHGSLAVVVGSDSIRVSAGTQAEPGIEFANGELTRLELSVGAEFSIKNLKFLPDSLGFVYRSADSTFTMHGSLAVVVGSDSIRVSAGTQAEPGIEFANGELKRLELSVGAEFSIKSLKFLPDSLGFVYRSADSTFTMHGSLAVVVGSDSIRVSAGTLLEPGIEFTNGQLKSLRLQVGGAFSIKSLTFLPDSLGFVYRETDSSFTMHGSLAAMVASDTIRVSAGTEADPGVVIAHGQLKKLHFTANAVFCYNGVSILPHGIGFTWISDTTNTFALYGSVTVTLSGSDHHASFGTADQPGFVIVNGQVTRWALSLTDTLKLSGLSIALTEASLAYDAPKNAFKIWGGATVSVGADTVVLFLGTSDQPGLSMVDGRVLSVSAGVTTSFTVGGLKLAPDHLSLAWTDSTHTVDLYGSLSATFDGQTTTLFAGSKEHPGIRIVNGHVTSVFLGVTADLRLSSLMFKPRGLTFAWADSGSFKLYGRATVGMAADSIDVMLGDSTDPGILIVGNSLEHLNAGVTADFHISKLRLQPKALTFRYDKPTGAFSLFGSIVVHVAEDSLAALLGDSTNPGLVYSNGALRHVNIGVTTGFGVKGLHIKTNALSLVWSSDSNYFKLYGGAGISIGPDSIGCDFGTAQHPGLIVKDGQLQYLSINVNSDLKIGNLEIKVQDLDLVYENARYLLKGSCRIDQVFSVSVTLGSGDTPGIILDVSTPTPQFIVQDLTLQIAHANLGAIDLKNFRLQITNGQLASSAVSIAFPGGWEVGAGIAFTGSPARIDSIGVDWAATSFQSAIVLPNGMLLAGMRGSLKHLTDPSQLTFAGDILLLYGGPVSIMDHEGTLIYLKTFATISSTGMTIGADAKIGAYKVDANWQSVLGEGTATLTLVWGRSAKLQGYFRIPSAPNQIVEIQPLVYLDSHKNFDALLGVTFYAPGFLPIIGGWRIGDASGAMRYRNGDIWHSYAAAWASGHAWLFDWTVGAEYNFGSRNISVLGGGEVSTIRREIEDDTRTTVPSGGALMKTAGRPVRSIVHSFTTTTPSPSVLLVAIQWPARVDSTVVTVLGPEGFYELTRLEEMQGESLAVFLPSQEIEHDFAVVSGDSVATFIVAPSAAFTNDSTVTALLSPGQYRVICTSYDTGLDSVGLIVLPMYRRPNVDIQLTDGPAVNVTYSSMRTESTLVDIFVNDAPSYTGKLVKHVSQNIIGEDGSARVDTLFRYEIDGHWVAESDSLWFYAVVEDGLNPPLQTRIVGPYYMPPALKGSISVTEGVDTVTSGLLLYIDGDADSSWDTRSTGSVELHSVVDSLGTFRFPALPEGIHRLSAVVPPGYTLLHDGQPVSAMQVDYRGMPIRMDLALAPSGTVP